MERMRQENLDIANTTAPKGAVVCLGMSFANDEERRAFFVERLREKLQDPEFRKLDGFPVGTDDDILRLSDPPYYTACPNPFLDEFVRHYGRPYDPEEAYHREPFAVNFSEGKTDPIYTAHSYHTKVPHKAIMRAILHYTAPGDIILDGFAGSGMTGIAAQLCGSPDQSFRTTVEREWYLAGKGAPEWGLRRAILNDLGPAATFLEANYNSPFDLTAFGQEGRRILDELELEIGWMYETLHSDTVTKCRINYTVWSDVFACPSCGEDVTFYDEALDLESSRVKETFPCPHCRVMTSKGNLQRLHETYLDTVTGTPSQRIKRKPVLINYTFAGKKVEKKPDLNDLDILRKTADIPLPATVPANEIPYMHMTHERARMSAFGVRHVHHFYLHRSVIALGLLWGKVKAISDVRTRNMLFFWIEQAIWGMSLLNRYQPIQQGRPGGSQVNRQMTGVYYISSQVAEVSPWYNLNNKLDRLVKVFSSHAGHTSATAVTTGTAARTSLPDSSIDYIFTDPPFGENIYYADLNFLAESWHQVWTDSRPEAIVDRAKKKRLAEYQQLMEASFCEYYRVLKPGRWITVVFHNSHNTVWNALQESMLSAGFIVSDVRELDKQQGSYRQVTSPTVQQDLIVSAYKPTVAFQERIQLKRGSDESVWEFVRDHLEKVPKFAIGPRNTAQIIPGRTADKLFDRVVAYHVRNNLDIPFSLPEFRTRLVEPLVKERDGMYFLPHQVPEYEQKRYGVDGVQQMQVLITDESTAIQWLRQELYEHPQTRPTLTPKFMKAMGGWAKGETELELIDILNDSFLQYEGTGPIPMQIWAWMERDETISQHLEGKDREQPPIGLRLEAEGRWYVPNPNEEQDVDKLRQRNLLRIFEEYKHFKGRRLKLVRVEAVKAGFKKAYAEKDYETILDVAAKLSEEKLHSDSLLLRWYTNAQTRAGRKS